MCARTKKWVDISEIDGPLIGEEYQHIHPKTPKRQKKTA